jgi:hypothetical protein
MPGPDAFSTVCLAPGKCGRCEGTDADRFEDKTQPENPVPLCLFLHGAAHFHVHTMLEEAVAEAEWRLHQLVERLRSI